MINVVHIDGLSNRDIPNEAGRKLISSALLHVTAETLSLSELENHDGTDTGTNLNRVETVSGIFRVGHRGRPTNLTTITGIN